MCLDDLIFSVSMSSCSFNLSKFPKFHYFLFKMRLCSYLHPKARVVVAWDNEGQAHRRVVPTKIALSDSCAWGARLRLQVSIPTEGFLSIALAHACPYLLIHSAGVDWLITLMTLQADSENSLSNPFFLFFFESEFTLRNPVFYAVLTYPVSLMINVYSGQSVRRQPCSLCQLSL